jgi:hypothetical protein
MATVDFRDRWGVRRKDLSEKAAMTLAFSDTYLYVITGRLFIEPGYSMFVWDETSGSWVDVDD